MTVSATRVIRSCKRHAMASLKTLTVETLKGGSVGKPTKAEPQARTPLFGRGPTATEAALLNCNKARRLR
jgi:hypothetical protein